MLERNKNIVPRMGTKLDIDGLLSRAAGTAAAFCCLAAVDRLRKWRNPGYSKMDLLQIPLQKQQKQQTQEGAAKAKAGRRRSWWSPIPTLARVAAPARKAVAVGGGTGQNNREKPASPRRRT